MKRPKLGNAVYILPNLLTTGNLFFGFFSIVKSLQGDFKWAASAILLAAIFDVLDGRVARLTGGTSDFGVQYDSLCDMVSFGVAPSFLMYQFALHDFGRVGWVICFLFMACGSLRLARFNVQSSIGKASGDFTGLPIPMAAGVIATFVALFVDMGSIDDSDLGIRRILAPYFLNNEVKNLFLLIYSPFLAFSMVSTLAYRSHKTLLKGGTVKPFNFLVLFVSGTALLAFWPEFFGFTLMFFYSLSGLIEWVFGWKKTIDHDEIFEISDDFEEESEGSSRRGKS